MITPLMRWLATVTAASMIGLGLNVSLRAETYPQRPLTIIVAFAPGGVADTTARLLANGLQARLGQPVIVENRPGAGGDIAAGLVARAAPDGYTLLVTTTALAINMTLNKTRQFSPESFAAIAILASSPEVLAVSTDNPSRTLSDFLKSMNGKTINFGTAGVGSASHIMSEYFFGNVVNARAVHIPFQGGAPAINALLGNQIDVMAAILGGGVAGQIQSGQIKGIAVASRERVHVLPDIPTFAEAGFTEMNFADWVGLFAPRDTDPVITSVLNQQTERILRDPEVLGKLAVLGFDPHFNDAQKTQHDFNADIDTWGRLIETIGLSVH